MAGIWNRWKGLNIPTIIKVGNLRNTFGVPIFQQIGFIQLMKTGVLLEITVKLSTGFHFGVTTHSVQNDHPIILFISKLPLSK